jgi:hypothetical protein
MRTSLLAVLLGLSMAACIGAAPGDPSGGGGGTGGGGGGGGGGIDPTPDAPPVAVPVPAVAVTVDQPTITSNLGVSNKILVTVTGSMGFSGPVNLAVSAVDGTGSAMADWVPTIDNATVTLTENGTATANVTFKLAGDVAQLAGSIKIAATSTADEADATTAVTENPVFQVVFDDNASGVCQYTGSLNTTFNLKLGRALWVVNGSQGAHGLITHVDPGGVGGMSHQNINGTPTAVGDAYKETPTNTGTADFYCHQTGNTMADGAAANNNNNSAPKVKVVN